MSEQSKAINSFFCLIDRDELDSMLSKIILTERQEKIMRMKYLEGHDINFIADTIGLSQYSVDKELRKIRAKIAKALDI